jgi:hypothetical protein
MYHMRFALFLNKKVNVVDAQGSQLLDRALEGHEETAEGYVGVAVGEDQSAHSACSMV